MKDFRIRVRFFRDQTQWGNSGDVTQGVGSRNCFIQGLWDLGIVGSTGCFIQGLWDAGIVDPGIVLSRDCRIQGLFYPGTEQSWHRATPGVTFSAHPGSLFPCRAWCVVPNSHGTWEYSGDLGIPLFFNHVLFTPNTSTMGCLLLSGDFFFLFPGVISVFGIFIGSNSLPAGGQRRKGPGRRALLAQIN